MNDVIQMKEISKFSFSYFSFHFARPLEKKERIRVHARPLKYKKMAWHRVVVRD